MKITKSQLKKIVLEERRKLQENYVSPDVIHDAMKDIEKALLMLLEEGATTEFLVNILQEICLVDCGNFNSENKLYKLDNGQYLYKGVCCGVYTLLEANGEDNGLATR